MFGALLLFTLAALEIPLYSRYYHLQTRKSQDARSVCLVPLHLYCYLGVLYLWSSHYKQ